MRCLLAVALAACAATPRPAPPPPPAPPSPAPAPTYTGLGKDSVSPELVAKYAPPPLDPALAARIQAFLDVRSPRGSAVTSRGDRAVFNWSVTGTMQVWRQDGPMRYPIQLTGGDDPTQAVDLTPDDRWVLVSRDRGGEENPGLYLVSIEGGPLVEIQHKEGVRTRPAFISDDGRFVYFLANDTDPKGNTLYRWERASRRRESVFSASGLWNFVDHLGERVLFSKVVSTSHNEVWELDLGTRKLTPVLGQGAEGSVLCRYGARPGTMIVLTDNLADKQRLYEWKAGAFTPLSPESPDEVVDFAIDETRARILYTVNHQGYRELHAIDARSFEPLALPELPRAENVRGGTTTRNGRFTNITVDGATLPPTALTYDWQTRKATSWRVPSTPEIDLGGLARGTLEQVPARDGTQIPMFVHRPASCAEPCPVIVEFHGGPESQALGGWNLLAQIYVASGFVYVTPNVRGSDGYGKQWVDADNGPRRLKVITDVEDVALYIRKAWAKDGRAPRIGITGGSYGGYATLLAMTRFAGAYDAGVSNVGMANLVTFLSNTAAYRRALRISEYGDPERDRAALVELSPITYIDRLKSPLLLMQGVNDPRVPVGEALQFHDALEARGIANGLILFADEGHGAVKRDDTVLQIGHTLAFFEKHLR